MDPEAEHGGASPTVGRSRRWSGFDRTRVWCGAWILAVVAWATAGCGEPLKHDLDESEANTMVVALDDHGVDARKIPDPGDEERWAVEVPRSQRVEAWSVLEREGVPRPEGGGFEDFYPGGGLIPTAQEERVVYQYATAEELESSLLHLDRIVGAHVHLVLPEEPRVQMPDGDGSEPRASVLIRWTDRGEGEAPIGEGEIRELISGAVEDLDDDAVHVVMTPVGSPEDSGESKPDLVQVGPLAVAPESRGLLKGLVLSMGATIIALAAGLVYVVLRRRRADRDEGEAS